MNRYAYSTDGVTAENKVYYAVPSLYDTWSKAERMTVGWYDGIVIAPEEKEGVQYAMTGWVRDGDEFKAVFAEIEIPSEEIKYSVRSIIRELKVIGKFDAVRSLLETANYDWDFIGSNYLSSTDSDFQTMMAAIVSQGILTQAELDALLPKCIWEQTPMS